MGGGKWKYAAAAAVAKSLQSCPTLYDPIHGSPPGCPIPGILQARTLEWVAISFSNAWKWKVKVKSLSRVRLLGGVQIRPIATKPVALSLFWGKVTNSNTREKSNLVQERERFWAAFLTPIWEASLWGLLSPLILSRPKLWLCKHFPTRKQAAALPIMTVFLGFGENTHTLARTL